MHRVVRHKRGWAVERVSSFMGKTTKTVVGVRPAKAEAEALREQLEKETKK